METPLERLLRVLAELVDIQDMSLEELDSYPEGTLDERAAKAWSEARAVLGRKEVSG